MLGHETTTSLSGEIFGTIVLGDETILDHEGETDSTATKTTLSGK